MNYLLNNGSYCTKLAHSHFLFGQLFAPTEKFNNGLCTHFARLRGLRSSRNSLLRNSRLINLLCEWTLTPNKLLCLFVLVLLVTKSSTRVLLVDFSQF